MDAVIPMVVGNLKANHLAPRGCLVRVRCGTDQTSRKERWFAVGIYFQRLAEAAVCNLPQIESTNAVFARRPLKRAEIELLRLRRGQVVECSVSNDAILVGFGVFPEIMERTGQRSRLRCAEFAAEDFGSQCGLQQMISQELPVGAVRR